MPIPFTSDFVTFTSSPFLLTYCYLSFTTPFFLHHPIVYVRGLVDGDDSSGDEEEATKAGGKSKRKQRGKKGEQSSVSTPPSKKTKKKNTKATLKSPPEMNSQATLKSPPELNSNLFTAQDPNSPSYGFGEMKKIWDANQSKEIKKLSYPVFDVVISGSKVPLAEAFMPVNFSCFAIDKGPQYKLTYAMTVNAHSSRLVGKDYPFFHRHINDACPSPGKSINKFLKNNFALYFLNLLFV